MDNKINCLHERSLRIVYSDHSSTFEELLERDKSFSNHLKNIQSLYCVKSVQIRSFSSPNAGKYGLEKTPYLDTFHAVLAIEIYKYVKGLSPEIMNSLFHWKKKMQSENCIWAPQSQPKNSKIWYRNSLVFSGKYIVYNTSDRSSHQRCSLEKGVLKNFAKFTGKQMC